MKHALRIIIILLSMFLATQLIGLAVINAYSPEIKQVANETTGEISNIAVYNLPYGMNPPKEITPSISLISIVFAIIFVLVIMLILMSLKAEFFLRLWFFVVVAFALAITINSAIQKIQYASIIALAIALLLAFLKIFKRNIIIHNLTELLIYPGIAAIFVPILSVRTVVLLLILISAYDVYAVSHAGIMQKMAKYQIKHLRLFAGFFVPYLKQGVQLLRKNRLKNKKIKMSVAILGGGDIAFPLILAGVVFSVSGLLSALFVSFGATLALAYLMYISQKGKFYPAMPFISIGCFIGLVIESML